MESNYVSDGANMDEQLSLPKPNISSIKNKQRRTELYKQMKREQRKIKKKEKERRQRENEELGENAPPKQIPKTIENQRVKDETMVQGEDEEVQMDEAQDEMASYFNRETTPKIIITTADKITARTNKFCKELKKMIPNSDILYRRGLDLKKIIKQAVVREYTDLIVVNEDQKQPNGIVISHLPEGPTLHFKVSNVRFAKEIKRSGQMSHHLPEVVLNNFGTRLGHTVGRLLASLFPHDPEFQGRRVVTFHNQRDFVFVRHHRYQFKSSKKVGLQELGPRFTLKLRSIQKGSFDSKYGEYEWVHKRHEMETSRRKFFL